MKNAPFLALCITSTLLLAAPNVNAQRSAPGSLASPAAVTLDAALSRALTFHPGIASAARELEAVRGERLQAGARLNPDFSMEVEGFSRESRTTTLQLAQPLELGGKRRLRMEVGDRAVDAAQARLAASEAEVRSAVTTAFFGALVAQEKVSLAKASLELAGQGSRIAGKRVVAGNLSPVEETRARVVEADFRLDLTQAQADLEAQVATLGSLTGQDLLGRKLQGDALTLPESFSRSVIQSRFEASPTIREARQTLAQATAAAELERAKRTPNVSLSVGMSRSEASRENLAIVGFSVPLPVADRNHGNILAALKRRERAEEDLRLAELRQRIELDASVRRLDTALTEVKTLDSEVLPGARSAYEAITRGFELGRFGALDALDAQRTWLQTRARYLSALERSHLARIEIERILGPDPASPNASSPAMPIAVPPARLN